MTNNNKNPNQVNPPATYEAWLNMLRCLEQNPENQTETHEEESLILNDNNQNQGDTSIINLNYNADITPLNNETFVIIQAQRQNIEPEYIHLNIVPTTIDVIELSGLLHEK